MSFKICLTTDNFEIFNKQKYDDNMIVHNVKHIQVF